MRNESPNSSRFSVISDKYFEMDFSTDNLRRDFPEEYNPTSKKYNSKNSLTSILLTTQKNNNNESKNLTNKNRTNTNNININTNNKNNNPQEQTYSKNFLACIYMLIAVLLFSFMNLGGKLMLEHFPEIDNITTCFFRGLITMLLALHYMHKEKTEFFSALKKKGAKKTFLLITRNFIWAFCNYSLFEALKHMRISSAFTLYNTSPIITSLLSVFFFKSKFTKFDFFSLLICFASVCFITKPAFLNFFFRSEISGEDSYLGISIVLVSAFFTSIGILLNKLIAQDFHFILSTVFYGFFFVFDSLILSFFKNLSEPQGFNLFSNFKDFCLLSICLVCLIGIVNFFNINVYTYSLNIGDPVVVLPLTYIGIVLNMVYNSFVFGKKTDFFDVLGSFLIIAVNVKRILDQRKK